MYEEWNYRWIKPKVIIEECLIDDNGDMDIPKDFKFFCFNNIFIDSYFKLNLD